jgi:hypothetical protein
LQDKGPGESRWQCEPVCPAMTQGLEKLRARPASRIIRFHSMIVKYVARIGFFNFGVLGAGLMQNPDAIGVGQEN